ncbi:hypothetical protein [Nevskia soli]|nr:hypothetical protein [Nevskia soli]
MDLIDMLVWAGFRAGRWPNPRGERSSGQDVAIAGATDVVD